MKRVKELIKDVLFILIIIIIFKTVVTYQLAKTHYETYEYTVNYGETLWNIAADICEDNDELYIKNVINDIRDINDLENPTIYVGQTLKLPIYD